MTDDTPSNGSPDAPPAAVEAARQHLERASPERSGRGGVTPLRLVPSAREDFDEGLTGIAHDALRLRQARANFFPASLFADPAWDILLDLFVARNRGARTALGSLCATASVPPTTALRWIKTLEGESIIRRRGDPHDSLQIYVELSEPAYDAMRALLGSVPSSRPSTRKHGF